MYFLLDNQPDRCSLCIQQKKKLYNININIAFFLRKIVQNYSLIAKGLGKLPVRSLSWKKTPRKSMNE